MKRNCFQLKSHNMILKAYSWEFQSVLSMSLDDEDNFYINLPSNASLDYYPENTLSKFKVRLPQNIELDREGWECGLVEIHFPSKITPLWDGDSIYIGISSSIFSMGKKEFEGEEYELFKWKIEKIFANKQLIKPKPFKVNTNRIIEEPNAVTIKKQFMPEKQNMSNGYEFIDSLTRFFSTSKLIAKIETENENEALINIEYSAEMKRLKLRLNPKRNKPFFLAFGAKLARILGFSVDDRQVLFFETGEYLWNDHLVDINANKPPFFYVYSNIIRPSIVGDILAPTLRVVLLGTSNDASKKNDVIAKTFTQVNYYKLRIFNFQDIEIELRTNSGELVPFLYGCVNVLLHFRKNQREYNRGQ